MMSWYNVIYFNLNRKVGERKLDDSLRLLVSGTLLFLAHGQEENGTELSILLGDHLLNHHTSPSSEFIKNFIHPTICA